EDMLFVMRDAKSERWQSPPMITVQWLCASDWRPWQSALDSARSQNPERWCHPETFLLLRPAPDTARRKPSLVRHLFVFASFPPQRWPPRSDEARIGLAGRAFAAWSAFRRLIRNQVRLRGRRRQSDLERSI